MYAVGTHARQCTASAHGSARRGASVCLDRGAVTLRTFQAGSGGDAFTAWARGAEGRRTAPEPDIGQSAAAQAARLAEAERDRLVAQAIGKPRPVRATVASVLRTLASWLDDTPTAAGERRLARAI